MTLRNNLSGVIHHLTSKGFEIGCVYDVGANKGSWTVQRERELPNAQFCLFEANPALPRPGKLTPKHRWFNVVLSSADKSEVEFYSITDGKFSGTGDSYYKEQTKAYDNCQSIKLPTTTLDILIKEQNLPLPQLLKLDTQGSELDILSGAESVDAEIIVTELAVLPYNNGAPVFNDYIQYFMDRNYIPVGVEEIHIADNMLVQFDIVFLRRDVRAKYYGDKEFIRL